MVTSGDDRALRPLLAGLGRDGRDFEHLTKWFLESDPESVAQYSRVWLWRDWPGNWGPDKGIDLIAETHDDEFVAVQAKNYGVAHSITKRDIDTFLSESNRPVIAARLLVATTDRVAASALEVMAGQEKPVSTCLLSSLNASPVMWPDSMAELAPAPPPRARPRAHQVKALDAIDAWVRSKAERGQVIMACGTGKSLVAVWAAERMEARRVLVLAPTLDLLRQLSRVWAQHSQTSRRLLHISSDSDRLEDDITRGDELATMRSTDPGAIAARLASTPDLLVLCTYNSSKALAEAMTAVPNVSFDLAVVDEAHRCAGAASSSHKTILKPEAIRSRRRLFFTATPTIFATNVKARAANRNVRIASMDDRELFGTVIHRLRFGDAIQQGLLCRYQVAVIPIDNDEVLSLIQQQRFVTADGDQTLLAGSMATQIACARAMRRYGCHRVVAFQPSIAQSRRFAGHFPVAANLLPADERPDGDLWCAHVDGSRMPFATRSRLIAQFKADSPTDEYRLLSNVRLLAEGVDVPGIDAIAFVDTRRGHAQIIQAVGRAVRTAPGKTLGTIVLPIVLRADETIEAALARTEHRMVVDVLGALRSHDPGVVKSLDTLRFNASDQPEPPGASGRFVIDAPVTVGQEFAAAVEVALANALGVPPPRRDAAGQPRTPVIVEERRPPTEEEMFLIGVDEVRKRARWELMPDIPADATGGFPLRDWWWPEVKQRWRKGELGLDVKLEIANGVSWLCPDLHDTAQQAEMIDLTDRTISEQVAVQLSPDGVFADKLSQLLERGGDPDHLIEEFGLIHRAVSHFGMTAWRQLQMLLIALRHLAGAVRLAGNAPPPPSYAWTSQRKIAIEAFVWALRVERSGPSVLDRPHPPANYKDSLEAHEAGVAAIVPFVSHVQRMRAYQFPHDEDEVRLRREEEIEMHPDQRLDALGWDIYMLMRSTGGSPTLALHKALDGNLRQREAVRRDRLVRAISAVRKEDARRAQK